VNDREHDFEHAAQAGAGNAPAPREHAHLVEDACSVNVLIEHLFRRQAGRMVAHLTGVLGPAHIDLAEESVQDAMLRALGTWQYQGVPENPAAWLFRVAHNSAIDALRRKRLLGDKTDAIVAELSRVSTAAQSSPEMDEQIRDDELRMIFMCCHPEISREASVALSLKTIGGFSVPEIARAFFAPEATTAQRIVRAKRQIRERRLTLELPRSGDLAARVDSVLEVLYLMFNEGYAAHAGEQLIRHELCVEALRLARLLANSAVSQPRAHALVALMAFQAARFHERVDKSGDLILLERQDRSRWDRGLIALGFHHFDQATAGEDVSEYHVQAAIAATHARARDAESTDWQLILSLYDDLAAMNPSPVILLNRVVAVSKVHGAEAALRDLTALEGEPMLQRYYLFLAVRGQLLNELGRVTEAVECFRMALACSCSEPERRFLRSRLKRCQQLEEARTHEASL
jgi:RNA polymerase sigma factor (sigma-70 family)